MEGYYNGIKAKTRFRSDRKYVVVKTKNNFWQADTITRIWLDLLTTFYSYVFIKIYLSII